MEKNILFGDSYYKQEPDGLLRQALQYKPKTDPKTSTKVRENQIIFN